ncbi:MAG: right-handed parallel beta-helix repeat-containing protein, partial [candidate division Zixibacteria bacterium]
AAGNCEVRNCLFSYNDTRGTVVWWMPYTVDFICNNSFGNGSIDYDIYDEEIPFDSSQNIQLNPMYCDTATGNLHLDILSPCSPSSIFNPCGLLIGALDTACNLATDTDGDAVPDVWDNCPDDYNPGQEDGDNDGIGDVCDPIFNRTWYVKADGSGDAPTIQAAVDSALTGDSILVAAGTYTGTGNRDITFYSKNLTLLSEDGAELTIIDCQGSVSDEHQALILQGGQDTSTVIDGLTITGSYMSDWNEGAIRLTSSSAIIRNCVVTANTGHGIYQPYGSIYLFLDSCEISGHSWSGVQAGGDTTIVTNSVISSNDQEGIFWESWAYLEVSNCLFAGNGERGLFIWTDSPEFHVSGCTFYDNNIGLTIDWNFPKGDGSTSRAVSDVSNNIFAFNQSHGLFVGMMDFGATIQCNDAFGNVIADYQHDSGTIDTVSNISLNPFFCDTATSDFRIDMRSPCMSGNPLNPCGSLIGLYGLGCNALTDSDADMIPDEYDNCPFVYNPDQDDLDNDGIGDACETRVWYVKPDGTGDAPTIGAAYDAANAGDTILLAAGTFIGAGNTYVQLGGKSLVVTSESGPNLTTIDMQGAMGPAIMFYSEGDTTTEFDGVTITGTAGHIDTSALMLGFCAPTISNCIIENNLCNGIKMFDASPKIVNCQIRNNDGFGLISASTDGMPQLMNCNISSNGRYGLWITGTGLIQMDSCVVAENAEFGLLIQGTDSVYAINHCTFVGNLIGFEQQSTLGPKLQGQSSFDPTSVSGNIFAF